MNQPITDNVTDSEGLISSQRNGFSKATVSSSSSPTQMPQVTRGGSGGFEATTCEFAPLTVTPTVKKFRYKKKIINSIWNFVNLVISNPLVTLPYTFVHAGMALGLCFLLLHSVVSGYTSCKLAKAGHRVRCLSYEELVRFCFGSVGYMLCLITILFHSFGSTVSRIVLIGDMMTPLHRTWLPHAFSRPIAVVLVCSVVAFPLALRRRIGDLRYSSQLSLLANLIIVGLLFHQAVDNNCKGKHQFRSSNVVSGAVPLSGNTFIAFGTICFLFTNQEFTFPVYKATGSFNYKHWVMLTFLSMSIAFLVCAMIAVLGVVAFGDVLMSDVLQNFSDSNAAANSARALECFIVMSGVPLDLFISRHVLFKMFGFESSSVSQSAHFLATVMLFVLSLIPGTWMTDLGFAQSISGCLTGVLIGFIFPPLCVFRVNILLSGRLLDSWKDVFLVFVVLMGVVALTGAIISVVWYGTSVSISGTRLV